MFPLFETVICWVVNFIHTNFTSACSAKLSGADVEVISPIQPIVLSLCCLFERNFYSPHSSGHVSLLRVTVGEAAESGHFYCGSRGCVASEEELFGGRSTQPFGTCRFCRGARLGWVSWTHCVHAQKPDRAAGAGLRPSRRYSFTSSSHKARHVMASFSRHYEVYNQGWRRSLGNCMSQSRRWWTTQSTASLLSLPWTHTSPLTSVWDRLEPEVDDGRSCPPPRIKRCYAWCAFQASAVANNISIAMFPPGCLVQFSSLPIRRVIFTFPLSKVVDGTESTAPYRTLFSLPLCWGT